MAEVSDSHRAAFERAVAQHDAGALVEAAAGWRALLEIHPDQAVLWQRLGVTLRDLGEYELCEQAMRRAVAVAPDDATAYHDLAGSLHRFGRWDEAAAAYRDALARSDGQAIRKDFGQLLVGMGDFEAGWPLYEARKDFPGSNSIRLPHPNEWAGEPLAGRSVIVWPEQGFGDQIQFVRFVRQLQAQGAEVTVVAWPVLHGLFSQLPVKVVRRQPNLRIPAPDYWTLYMSIPAGLGLRLQDLDGAAYLSAPQRNRERWAGSVQRGSIGYAWRGRPTHGNDAHRSLPSPDPLVDALRVTGAPLVDLTEPLGDFADLAAVIEQLELVVTVDTAVAHVAGALGKPCWIMLPWLQQDWRWMQGRDDSPWYDSVRLFRQQRPGDWAGVLGELSRNLAKQWRGAP